LKSPSGRNSIPTDEQIKLLEENQLYLNALFDFIIKINQIDSISEIIWHLAQHTIKSLGFEDCVIYLLDQNQIQLKQVAAYGPKSPYQEEIINPISLQIGEGIVGKAAEQLHSILVKDTRQNPSYIIDDQSRLSELAVPIIFKNQLLGVIDSEHSQVNFFTEHHQRNLEIIASVLASKLSFEKNIDALEQLISALEESKKLTENYLEISNLTYSSPSEKELYTQLHKLVSKQVNTQSFYIVLFDKSKNHYSFPYMQDELQGSRFDISFDQHVAEKTLVAEVIQQQTPLIVSGEKLRSYFQQNRLLDQQHLPYSWLAVPFEISESLTGAIALQSYNPATEFSHKDKQFLVFLGQHISSAIERKFKDQKLHYQALHDPVTGLANRTLFMDRIEHAYSLSVRQTLNNLAVLFVDLDEFKFINDKFGHQTGDTLLKITAERMQSQLRASDTLARLGGDEFAILLESLESQTRALKVANRILEIMQQPMLIDEHTVSITVSIGIGLKDENTQSAEDLLKNADHAMYHAKKLGKNSVQIYEANLHQVILHERQLLHELKIAIEQQQLVFYYQPIVNLSKNEIIGFEALMRWKHPDKGIISPQNFIKVAEQNDLIKAIDSQLLSSIAKQLEQWQKQSQKPLYISFNISGQRFVDSQLIQEIKQLIKTHNLRPGSLVVEVTEHVLMKNIGKARHLFHQLKSLGIRISLDDFGTGYSSLSYLNQLPFDILKIDRSFVTKITEQNPDHPIINMIVALANTMKIDLVAEGVETILQLKTLTKMACSFGQGYYFAKPLPAIEAEKLVTDRRLKPFSDEA